MWNFVFFARRQITGACLFVVVFFFQGSSYRPSGPRMSQEGLILMEMKSSSALFKWPKKKRAPRPPLTLIFSPKPTDQNFEIAILFCIVKNHNNYVFENDLLPQVPGGGARSYKLWPVFTHNNGYWEVCRRFQGDCFGFGGGAEERGLCGRIFPWRNTSRGKRNSMKRAQDFQKTTIKKMKK